MIINLGPQHPSTHGVLRLMLELDGETVLRTKPVIGYLHTGMEKTGEELMYVQGGTNVTRMDYLSPFSNECVFSLAVEKLLEHRGPAAGRLDPDADAGAQPDQLARPVPRHQRARHGRHLGDDLRLAGAGAGPRLLRAGHRPAHEPQLHPSRRRGRRPARRLARRRPRHPRACSPAGSTSSTRCSPTSRSGGSGPRASASSARAGAGPRRHRPDPAVDRRRLGPARRHAVPGLRPGRVRRHHRDGRRRVRPLRHPPQRDPRVDPDRPPDPRQDAARATTASRTPRSRRRRAAASTSRWRR